MPIRRRKDKRRNIEPDADTRWNLELGWLHDVTGDEMREAWGRHGDWIMERQPRAGIRAHAWWVFDSGLGYQPDDEATALYEMGLLDATEIAQVRRDYGHLPEEMWPAFMRAGYDS